MKKKLLILFLTCMLFSFCLADEIKNPYIPNEINIWIDKEFLKYYQDDSNKGYKAYSTGESEKELLRELIELLRLQLKTNLILIKQNKRLIELLQKKSN